MIPRKMALKLKELSKKFPAIALLGPRQVGKTTLAKATFPNHVYVSLEDLDTREFALSDPRHFLEHYLSQGSGLILDEVQVAPDLLSYLQSLIDSRENPGEFILTGSQNLLLNEHISQTLAGRAAFLNLQSFSLEELPSIPNSFESFIFRGGYPRIQAKGLSPTDWYPSYIRAYLERDVRQIKNIPDLLTFSRFLKLCAGRIGQRINWSNLAADVGVSSNTIKSWISVLEASYIIFLLPSYHKNFKKRITKSPKLYFYDTGIACSLLGIEKKQDLELHFLRGALFESMVISELLKKRFNQGKPANCSYWLGPSGKEIDCLIEEGTKLLALEIKSSKTISNSFFDNLKAFTLLANIPPSDTYLVYGGDSTQKRSHGNVISWKGCSNIK